MSKHPTLLQHFRSFAYQNHIKDYDKALQYFAVFGATGWDIDSSIDIDTLIKEKILCNYESLHNSITRYTHNNPVYHQLLSAIALGTEYEHDIFQKIRVGKDRGEEAVDYLEKKSLLRFDISVIEPSDVNSIKSDRIIFRLPFMRFWFAMVSPYYKSISDGDFREFLEKWHHAKGNFHILLNNLLIRELAKENFYKRLKDDKITSLGSYYDKKTNIEILAVSKSGKMFAGECKYSKNPATINMLNLLKEKCEKSALNISEYMLFSKNGFLPEVLNSKDKNVTLCSGEDLSILLNDLNKNDLLTYSNRKY